MARPARAMSDEIEELEREDPDTGGGIDFEPADEPVHEMPRRKSDPKRYMLPLAGVVLVSALVAVTWMSFAPRRGAQQDREVLDLPQPVAATVEQPARNRSVRPAGNEIDAHLGSATSVSTAGRSAPSRAADAPAQSQRAVGSAAGPEGMNRTNEPPSDAAALGGVALEERLDRIESSLQTLQSLMESMRTEFSAARASQERHESPSIVEKKHVGTLRRQLTTRDPESVRSRPEVPINSHRSSEINAQSQHPAPRTGLLGWEIVGLSARNVALRDPGGRTHVVAIGESIVDDVELIRIDTVANRITTSAGEIAYRGAGSEPGNQ